MMDIFEDKIEDPDGLGEKVEVSLHLDLCHQCPVNTNYYIRPF